MKAMSSIRLPVVIPLVMIALWTAVKDTASYVRKAAANSIPKVFRVDQSQSDELIDMIGHLMRTDDTEVLGSALFAYSEVSRWP